MLSFLIGVIVFLIPLLGYFAPKGIAPAVIFGGCAGVALLLLKKKPINWMSHPVTYVLLILWSWVAISCFWAINLDSALIGAAKLLGNFIAGFCFVSVLQSLDQRERYQVLRCAFSGFMVITVIIVFEIFSGSVILESTKFYGRLDAPMKDPNVIDQAWFNIALVVLSLMVWPIILARYKKKNVIKNKGTSLVLSIIFILLIFIVSIEIGFVSVVVAILCAVLSVAFVYYFGNKLAAKGILIFLAVISLAPFLLNSVDNSESKITKLLSFPHSAEHRIAIWSFTGRKIAQKPFLGWGMNSSKHIPGGKSYLFSETGKQYGRALPLHPHNILFQLWLELGLPGIVVFLWIVAFITSKIINSNYSIIETAMIYGQIVVALVIASLSFGIWQAWWMATLWFSAGLMMLAIKLEPDMIKENW